MKCFAESDDYIIFPNPENYLHPHAQVRLVEIFTILVNCGIKVIFSTYSPYMIYPISNLLLGDEKSLSWKKKAAKYLYLENYRSFIETKDVEVYEVEDDKFTSLKGLDSEIQPDRLSNLFSDIQIQFFKIYDVE